MDSSKNSKTTYSLMVREGEKKTPPRIIFDKTSMKWIDSLIELHDTEVGFYAIVDTISHYVYRIRDVFYPKHLEAHGTTCEISQQGESDIMSWLIDHDRVEDVEKMKLWGHSHVNMGTSPSGQDETQALRIVNDNKDFLIRIICNKRGEMSCSFFDYKNNIRFDNVNWEIENTNSAAESEAKLAKLTAIANDARITPEEKLSSIAKSLQQDDELEEIKKKVLVLKKENIPKINTGHFVTNGYGQVPTKEFKRKRSNFPAPSNDPDDDAFDEIIENWRNGYESGFGIVR